MKLRNTITALLAMAVAGAQAQTLSTEITVDRTVTPLQTTATPLASVQPTLMTATPLSGELSLSDFGGDAFFSAQPDSVIPYLYSALPARSPYKGYASLGYFPVYRLGAQIGYALIDNEQTLLLASARFGGMNWHSDANDSGNSNTVSDNNFNIAARWLQRLGEHRLGAFAEFSSTYTKNLTIVGKPGNQNYTGIRAGLNLSRRADGFEYAAKINFDHFGASKDLATEFNDGSFFKAASNTVFQAELSGRLGHDKIAGDISAGVSTVSRKGGVVHCVLENWGHGHWGPGLAALHPESSNNTVGTFKLAATHSSRHLVLRVGLRADIATGFKPDRFNIAPDVELAWLPTGVTRVYLSASGQTSLNTLRERFDLMPFAPAWSVDRLQRVPLQAKAGFSYHPGRGFRAAFEGCFQRSIGAPMLLIYSPLNLAFDDKRSLTYAPMNLKGAWIEGRIGYSLPEFYGLDIDLSARANINRKPVFSIETSDPYDEEWGLPDNPDRAKWVVNMSASANPIEKLTVGIQWNLRAGRFVYYDDHRDGSNYGLESVNDLSINGLYRVNERLSVGLQLENILCHRYFLIPGVQGASLTGLLGATLRF